MTTQEQLEAYKDVIELNVLKSFHITAISPQLEAPFTINDMYIAGGAIRSLVQLSTPKDVDVFFKPNVDLEKVKKFFKDNHPSSFISENAVTMYIGSTQFQFIITSQEEPMKMVHEFDFTMNMNYYDFETKQTYIHDLTSITFRQLKINLNCRNKLGTLARITKFVERGYKIPDSMNLLELGVQISKEEPVTDFETLQEKSRLHFSESSYEGLSTVCNNRPYRSVVKDNSGSGVSK